ncbi:MAG TPA: DarT ssDNA thymidine ADP-ribosyltransferase family protein [Devosia sp.]|nr:DarT ssDNA thymidine ADP-ribosyltransferase family protein [Devosia sp.]
MGLTPAYIDAYVASWSARLTSPAYPYRAKWPGRLFHHGPIENIVQILQSGELLSRNDSEARRARDVAGADVINAHQEAHAYGRLYFRPRTPTQYHIEGIRRPADCHYGANAHAPVLVMLIFDARPILQMQGVRFSHGNMQAGPATGENDAFFATIPFDKVYHEGGISGDHSIIFHRCAEVLVPSPMLIAPSLQWIYCRSEAERGMLLYLLGAQAGTWEPRTIVSDDLKVFEKSYPFAESIRLSNEGLLFRLHPRTDLLPLAVRISAWTLDGAAVINSFYPSLAARPPSNGSWLTRTTLHPGSYRVEVELDGHLAYAGIQILGGDPF